MTATEKPEIPCGNQAVVPSKDSLLRAVHDDPDSLEWFADEERWLPTARELQFNPDCSVSWEQHLSDVHGRDQSSAGFENRPLVFQVGVLRLRDEGFLVCHSPQAAEPVLCAHSSIYWPGGVEPSSSARRRLRSKIFQDFLLVSGDVTSRVPPGA